MQNAAHACWSSKLLIAGGVLACLEQSVFGWLRLLLAASSCLSAANGRKHLNTTGVVPCTPDPTQRVQDCCQVTKSLSAGLGFPWPCPAQTSQSRREQDRRDYAEEEAARDQGGAGAD